jgi:hypothetical protein
VRSRLALVWLGQLLIPSLCTAQYAERIRWPLVDVLVRADSAGQVEILAAPNLASRQGHEPNRTIDRLWPRAADALQWANLMRTIVDSLADVPERPTHAMLAPALGSPTGDERVYLGLTGQRRPRFRFVMEPGGDRRAWQAGASAAEIRTLLTAVTRAASFALGRGHATSVPAPALSVNCPILSRDPAAVPDPDAEPPQLLSTAGLEFPLLTHQREGRVWLQFRIAADGSIAPGSSCILLTDGEPFSAALRRALPTFRYKPAMRHGVPLDCLSFQEFRFVYPRR